MLPGEILRSRRLQARDDDRRDIEDGLAVIEGDELRGSTASEADLGIRRRGPTRA
jgi:hypothetical protein